MQVDRSRTVVSDTDHGQATSPLPLVTGVDPAEGPEDGQTTIVLTGSRFTDASAVAFGDAVADGVSVDSDTQVTAVSPAGTGTVDITVTTPAGTSTTTDADAFTYRPAGSLPTINRIDPATGPETGQTTVEPTGSGFSLSYGGARLGGSRRDAVGLRRHVPDRRARTGRQRPAACSPEPSAVGRGLRRREASIC